MTRSEKMRTTSVEDEGTKIGLGSVSHYVAFCVVGSALLLASSSWNRKTKGKDSSSHEGKNTPLHGSRKFEHYHRDASFFSLNLDSYSYGHKPSIDPDTVKKSWWAKDGGVRFRSSNVMVIDTMNFNKTVTDPKNNQILIAFYDPRSIAFKELQPELDRIADALAKPLSLGDFLGVLGACDVTVNTWLGDQIAPELTSGWQEKNTSSSRSVGFRFGSPRFFPLVLVFFKDGRRVGEYTHAVDVKHVDSFLKLQRLKVGGSSLRNETEFRHMLLGPGPLGLGCGTDSSPLEQEAFNKAAHELHGSLAFGNASLDLCAKVLLRNFTEPAVLWARGKGDALKSRSSLRVANSTTMSNSTLLKNWLSSHREEILEQMTPDNSHKYLEDSKPLALLLVDARDRNARLDAEAIFEPVETDLRRDFNLVWSDCAEFGSQFQAEKDCPVVLVVNPESLDFEKKQIKSFTSKQSEKSRKPSERLAVWMRKTKHFQHYIKYTNLAAHRAVKNATNFKQKADKDKEPERRLSGEYLDELAKEPENVPSPDYNGGSLHRFLLQYRETLAELAILRHSYRSQYGHLEFDFSDMDKAQKLHESMTLLIENEHDVMPILQNSTRLKHFWGAIERRSDLEVRIKKYKSTSDSAAIASLYKKLAVGYNLLVDLFQRLYRFLEHHARQGSLGPKPSVQEVERRSASDLSMQEFHESYAVPGRPVIITGLNVSAEAWTLDYFKRTCNKTVKLQRTEPNSANWGGLTDAQQSEVIRLPDFIDTFTINETRRAWYLHDWSIPNFCPEVLGPAPYRGFTQPKYFAGDYFQRTSFDGYQHSWPSLFVGSNATQSKMHIDSGGTNFWFYLLSGRKEWRFFSRLDVVNLYQSMKAESFWVDAFDHDVKRFPLVEYAEMHVATQEPGEVIFIPGGHPHAVRNLEHIHGLSGNYVDASNLGLHLWHMMNDGKFNSVEKFSDGATVPLGLRSDQEPMEWGQWKSVPWHKLSYDLQ